MSQTVPPGQVIGILGGGQLGLMTALAAAPLGYRCHIFTPESDSPASQVTGSVTVAAYDDEVALARFAESVDVITYEFENIPLKTAEFLAARKPLRPAETVLAISQHRGSEKAFAVANNIPVAPYRLVTNRAELDVAAAEVGFPAVLKTCRFGYDGKGQAMLQTANDLDEAWAALATNDAILEGLVAFEKEISVIVARGLDGDIRLSGRREPACRSYPRHHDGPCCCLQRDCRDGASNRHYISRGVRLGRLVGGGNVRFAKRRGVDERDSATSAQFWPLDPGRGRHLPIRAARAGSDRTTAWSPRSLAPNGDAKSDRRSDRAMAGNPGRAWR